MIEGAPSRRRRRPLASAITVRAATADEIFDLLCKAHGLTDARSVSS